MRTYDPQDWYWRVATMTGVYSSKKGDYVSLDDPDYVAWLASDGAPTSIDTEANLGGVLAPLLLRPQSTASGVLAGYQAEQSSLLTDRITTRVFFNLENRVRALEGAPPLTPPQYKAFVRSLL